jgi:conjugal transfer pilus assembly protein TraB
MSEEQETTQTTWWKNLPADKKLSYKKSLIIAALFIVIIGIYFGSGESSKRGDQKPAQKMETLGFGDDLLQDDIREEVKEALSSADNQRATLQTEVDTTRNQLEEQRKITQHIQSELARLSNSEQIDSSQEDKKETSKPGEKYPTPPNYNQKPGYNGYMEADVQPIEIQRVVVGGIGHTKGANNPSKDTKKKRKIYLPPSMMEAVMLHGIDAMASKDAGGDQETIMIRVQAPAVLPNEIKAS